MKTKSLYAILLLIMLSVLLGQGALYAQTTNSETKVPDGPVVKPDTTKAPVTLPSNLMGVSSILPPLGMNRLTVPAGPMSRQDIYYAKRSFIASRVIPDISANLNSSIYTPDKRLMPLFFVAGFFLSAPLAIPEGYRGFNPSFPYALYLIPGGQPTTNMYGPDMIPQTIRSEFDMATGTYKSVMIPWEQVELNTRAWHLGGYNTSPLKMGPMNNVEREIDRINHGRF